MSAYICFTGRGYHNGNFLERPVWESLAYSAGWIPTGDLAATLGWHGADRTSDIAILVSSRSNTLKYTQAASMDVPIVTYDHFYNMRYRNLSPIEMEREARHGTLVAVPARKKGVRALDL
jgi:hypothetical protein